MDGCVTINTYTMAVALDRTSSSITYRHSVQGETEDNKETQRVFVVSHLRMVIGEQMRHKAPRLL